MNYATCKLEPVEYALGNDIITFNFNNLNGDFSVIDENTITRLAIPRKTLVGSATSLLRAFDLIGRDGEDISTEELMRAVFESSQSNFRALQIYENRNGFAALLCRGSDAIKSVLMLLVSPVREIKPGHVHSCCD